MTPGVVATSALFPGSGLHRDTAAVDTKREHQAESRWIVRSCTSVVPEGMDGTRNDLDLVSILGELELVQGEPELFPFDVVEPAEEVHRAPGKAGRIAFSNDGLTRRSVGAFS